MRFDLAHCRLLLLPLGLALVAGGCSQTTHQLEAPSTPIVLGEAPPPPSGVATPLVGPGAPPPDTAAPVAKSELPGAVPTPKEPPSKTSAAVAEGATGLGPKKPPAGSLFAPPMSTAKPVYPNINKPVDEPEGPPPLTADERAKAIADIQAQAKAAATTPPAPAVAPAVTPAAAPATVAKSDDHCKKDAAGKLPKGCKPAQ